MKNQLIHTQIANTISLVKVFQNACKIAAKKDDGVISKEEERQLKAINKASMKFVKELTKIKKME